MNEISYLYVCRYNPSINFRVISVATLRHVVQIARYVSRDKSRLRRYLFCFRKETTSSEKVLIFLRRNRLAFFPIQVLEDYVGKLRTSKLQTATNFRNFDPRTIARVYFRRQLFNFGPITVKIELL